MADKSLAQMVNDDMGGTSDEGLSPDDYDQGMQDATQGVIDAVKKGDASGVDAALRNWHEMAHKNWGDYPGDSGGASDSGSHGAMVIAVPHGGK